ncbi:MAG TPA: GYD domain-containing protein [Dongiaceae bacterium]
MPHYMLQGNYTTDAIKAMSAKPEDRSVPAGKLAKSLGGKLHSYFMCFGKYDFVAIMEFPDDEAAAASSMTVAAAGHVSHMVTTKLFTPVEISKAMAKAGSSKIEVPKGK